VPAQGGSRLPLVLLLHVVVVPIVPLPERSPGQAGVRLRAVVVAGVRGGDGGLVNHSWGLALARQWTGRLILAVATLVDSRGWSALGNHLCIVLCQDLRHIRHRFVTYFYCVRVKGAPQDVAWGEALGNDGHEHLRYVGGAVLGEWRVEPGDLPLPVVALPLLLLHPGQVGQLVVVPCCVQCCLVRRGRCLKEGLVGVGVGEHPGDAGWVVASAVHVGQRVALLGKGLECARGQVHGHVQKVHHLSVRLRSRDLQAVAVEDLVELVQHQLVLPFGEAADGEPIISVQPDVDVRCNVDEIFLSILIAE